MRGWVLLIALSGCANYNASVPGGPFYWDKPETDLYWIPKGTSSSIIPAARHCGAKTHEAVMNHGVVPPGFDFIVFRFVGSTPDAERDCVVNRLRAVRALTTYEKRR